RASSSSIASFPLHTWRRNSASTTLAASTSLASTRRSAADSFDRSAPISVGAKRAVMVWSVDTSGIEEGACANATPPMTSETALNRRRRVIILSSVQLSGTVKRAALLLSFVFAIASVEARRRTTAAVRLDTLRLPAGFSIAVYAEVPGARSMTLAPEGTVFVGSQSDTVHALVDRDQEGRAEEVVIVADNLQVANGVAFKDGALFVADLDRVLRYDDILDFVNQPAAARLSKPVPVVLLTGLPAGTYQGR